MLWKRRKDIDAFLLAVNPTAGDARELKLNKPECSVGTDESNDVIIHDSSVSRRHALIRRHRNKWQVLDRESTNGIYVGDRKALEWITLRNGQEVRFGGARFIFHAGQAFNGRNTGGTPARRVRVSRLRLLVVLILVGLIMGFAASQYLIYRSYQQKEALLHSSRTKE
jgi:pSer/pThr/pTyr-binding forkhead associated (FHA) protein